jgi:NitT/TauT family transport system ATP-binding protein
MDEPVPIVKFAALRKRYGDGPIVLDGLELTVGAGDFVSFIGPSGCGKSTVLKLVSGLNPPTDGGLKVLGTKPRLARDRQAFIFQDATLLPWLTAQGNAELPLRLRGVPASERREKAAALLARVGLEKYAAYYPRQLSGGMRMRVSIARALTLSPQLLLLDEPFGALDEMTRNRLNEELLDLRERLQFTALFVTHSVSEAVFLSNRIVVMAAHPGRIHAEVRVGFSHPRTGDLRERPEFQAKVVEVSRLLHEVEDAGHGEVAVAPGRGFPTGARATPPAGGAGR